MAKDNLTPSRLLFWYPHGLTPASQASHSGWCVALLHARQSTAAAHHALHTRMHERGARCAILHCTFAVHHTCWPLHTSHLPSVLQPAIVFVHSLVEKRPAVAMISNPLSTSHESRPSPPPPPLEHQMPAGLAGGRKRNRVRRQRASMDCCRGRHLAPSCDRLQRLQSTRPPQTSSLHRSEGTLHHCLPTRSSLARR